MAKIEKHIITANEILSLYEERRRYIVMANSYIKDFSTAEEIVHQCIFSLMQTKDSQYVSNPKAFFASAVKNRCLNYMKRKSRECSMDEDSGLKIRIDTEIAWLTAQSGSEEPRADFPELLNTAKSQMPMLTYDVFMAKRLDRMSYKEISQVFQISESRIHFEMSKALKVFKDYDVFLVFLLVLDFLWRFHE